MFNQLLDEINKINKKNICIGVNGINSSGKTCFSKKLKSFLEQNGKSALLISLDEFKYPHEKRKALQGDVVDNYLNNWFNYDALEEAIKKVDFSNTNIVIIEGIFIFTERFTKYMDFKILLEVDKEIAYKRILERDVKVEGLETTQEKWNLRSMPAQEIYMESNNPKNIADMIVDNNDFNNPKIIQL